MKVNKMVLTSNNLCLGSMPAANEETEQILTLWTAGKATLQGFCFGDHSISRTITLKVSAESVKNVFKEIEETMLRQPLSGANDGGAWHLEVYHENSVDQYNGSFLDEGLDQLSARLRQLTGLPDLQAFNGN